MMSNIHKILIPSLASFFFFSPLCLESSLSCYQETIQHNLSVLKHKVGGLPLNVAKNLHWRLLL